MTSVQRKQFSVRCIGDRRVRDPPILTTTPQTRCYKWLITRGLAASDAVSGSATTKCYGVKQHVMLLFDTVK